MSNSPKRRIAVVLAAGKGTRMRSKYPKPLFEVAGQSMLHWVLEAAREAGCERCLVVVGHQSERLKEAFADQDDIVWVLQEEQLGTGHALAQAEPFLAGGGTAGEDAAGQDAMLLVLNGDVPGVRASTLSRLADAAEQGWGAMAAAELDEPGRLGRVLADGEQLEQIVEAADADPEQLEIRLINAGLYAMPAPSVFDYLRRLSTDNAQGELYLTDALGLAAAASESGGVRVVRLEDADEALGINDRRDLARVHRVLIERHLQSLMESGVTLLDPATTSIEPSVRIGADTVVHGGVSLFGHTEVGEDCVIHQGCWVRDSKVADAVQLHPYSILDQAEVETDCNVGPFARLRPASLLQTGARVGNFVEIKNARLGKSSKANHLAYVGDADVGDDSNIGAGVVTCNYDGVKKHRTEIGARAFVGSDTMLVAPVRVGDEATTAAGSVITDNVPDGALGVARPRQRIVAGWAERKKARAQGRKSE